MASLLALSTMTSKKYLRLSQHLWKTAISPSDMKTNQFEAVKINMSQNRGGYILTLAVHPDEVPEEIFRDFVGSRYQVVMVRLNDDNTPLNRDLYKDPVKMAGILCKDPLFQEYLFRTFHIPDQTETNTVVWLRKELGILSRAELKDNKEACLKLFSIQEEFIAWKHQNA